MLSQKTFTRAMQQSSSSGNQEQHLRAQLELLQNHDADPSTTPGSRDSRATLSHSPPSRTANGYEELAEASHNAVRALAGKSAVDSHIHPELRAAQGHATPPPNMMPMNPSSGHSPGGSPGAPTNAAIAPAPSSSAPEPGSAGDGRKAKRELSQSKRAAQNRAAQRAFRQRKEGYIKKLEQQVREFADLEQTYKAMQSENYALREYVIHLQSRLLDATGEYPQPPPSVNLAQPTAGQAAPSAAEQQTSHPGVGTPLEAVAQAVAGLAAQEQLDQEQQQQQQQQHYDSPSFKQDRGEEDTRSADEINRELQQQQQSEEDAGRPAEV